MMLTPRQAIARQQVFLRPFAFFRPADQAFMGFAADSTRDAFLDQIEDGALVLIWTRSQDSEPGWQGSFRGILQLKKAVVDPDLFSSQSGKALRAGSKDDYGSCVQVVRAWEANPVKKVIMRNIIPTDWPAARDIGVRSRKMAARDFPNIEERSIRQVEVFGQPAVTIGPFEKIKDLFK